MTKHRIVLLVAMLTLLLMGTFALQTGVTQTTHASAFKAAQPPGPPGGPPRRPPSHCYGDECNGQQVDRDCYSSNSVQSTDYYGYGPRQRPIARLSIIYSRQCGAYYSELETYVRTNNGLVSIERGRLYYSNRAYGDRTDSPLLGEGRARLQITATGEFSYNGRRYSETIHY